MSFIPSNLDGLVGLADRTGIDIRPTLLRVLTDLYVQRPIHSPDEERQYTELALRLIEIVDHDIKSAVAKRLSSYPAAPAAILERLFSFVLEKEPTPPSVATSYDDSTNLTDLFFAADPAERRLIVLNLDFSSIAPATLPALRMDIFRLLERAAVGQRFSELKTLLQQALGISRSAASQIVDDQQGEALVVAAKALSIPPDVLHRILLFINPAIGQSADRVGDLVALHGEISLDAALRLVSIWREARRPDVRKGSYRPVHWDDEKPRVRHQPSSSRRVRQPRVAPMVQRNRDQF